MPRLLLLLNYLQTCNLHHNTASTPIWIAILSLLSNPILFDVFHALYGATKKTYAILSSPRKVDSGTLFTDIFINWKSLSQLFSESVNLQYSHAASMWNKQFSDGKKVGSYDELTCIVIYEKMSFAWLWHGCCIFKDKSDATSKHCCTEHSTLGVCSMQEDFNYDAKVCAENCAFVRKVDNAFVDSLNCADNCMSVLRRAILSARSAFVSESKTYNRCK